MTETPNHKKPKLVWVYNGSLAERLDAATWLETTRELRVLGWQVILINEGPRERNEINGVAVRSVPGIDLYLVRQALFHLRVLRDLAGMWRTVDIILFHQMSMPWLLPMGFVRRIVGKSKPQLIMDTRTAPMIPKELATPRDRVYSLFQDSMNMLANRTVDGQTAITERMAALMKIPEDHLLGIWPSGVDPQPFLAKQIAREWPIDDEPVRLIYVGVLQRERGLLTMCEAVEEANRNGMSFEFMLIGDGNDRNLLEQYAQNTEGRIRVFAPVPHNEIPGYLAQAHLGVLPFPDLIQFRVSSPIKLFEYMASGLAILATRIACHTDVVGDGGFAIWAEDSSKDALFGALQEAWDKHQELQDYGSLATKAVNAWTWQASAIKLDRALNQALDEETFPARQEQEQTGTGV